MKSWMKTPNTDGTVTVLFDDGVVRESWTLDDDVEADLFIASQIVKQGAK